MEHNRKAFILRLWTEQQGERPALRGSVQEAGSERTRYFHSLDLLLNTITDLAGELLGEKRPVLADGPSGAAAEKTE